MRDDPEEILEVQPASSVAESETTSTFWIAALVAPVICYSLGFVVAMAVPKNQNDWIGVSMMIPAFIAMTLACILSISFSVTSIRRREKYCLLSLISSYPCAVGAVWEIGLALKDVHIL